MAMIIDGIATSEHLDSSGEILKIEGHDISDLEEGRGVINFEHNNDSPEDILGSVIFAKKIMKKSDCSNDRERMYWDSCGTPFVYIKAELFDDQEHPGAIAAAALIRYYHKKGEKILAGFSIEGATLERDENILERTVGRRVAMTLRPCNKSAISGVLEDSLSDEVKKFMNLDAPILTRVVEIDSMIFEDINKSEINPLEDLVKAVNNLNKTLTAGNYNVAPSQLTGGSALQTEHQVGRSRGLPKTARDKLKTVVTQWDRKRPLREYVKAALPEVSDDYLDHFTELAEEISLKKGQPKPTRIDPHHSWNKNMNDKQRELVTGIYHNHDTALYEGNESKPTSHMTKFKNDAGQNVLIKQPMPHSKNAAVNSSNYYQLANDFFGMGDHVAVHNHINHPEISRSPDPIGIQEHIDGAQTPFHSSWSNVMDQSRSDGSLHKLAIMDMITAGASDRHMGNVLSKDGKIMHIDNDEAFNYGPYGKKPAFYMNHQQDEDGYVEEGIGDDVTHIDAVKWLNDLDPKKLIDTMLKQGQGKEKASFAAKRLLKLKQMSAAGSTLMDMHKAVAGGDQ